MKGFVYDTKHFEVYEHINSNDETEWQVVRYRTGGSASEEIAQEMLNDMYIKHMDNEEIKEDTRAY